MALTIALKMAMVISQHTTYFRGAWLTKRRAIHVPFEAINHKRRPHIMNSERVSIGPPKQAICRSDQICRGVWEIRMDSF